MTTAGQIPLSPCTVIVRDLAFRYPPLRPGLAPVQALDGISFRAEPGHTIGIYGTGGSGKSTLCLALNGIVPQATGGTIRGEVMIGDWSTRAHPIAELASRVSLVFQDPDASLIGRSVEDEVAFGPENLGVPPVEIEQRIETVLDRVGMAAYRRRRSSQLSGGEKQRVAIAAALAMQPAVLVLDEPTAALDPYGAGAVADILRDLMIEKRTTVILITEDADLLAALTDELLILEAGRVVLRGTPQEIFAHGAKIRNLGLAPPPLANVAARLNAMLNTDFAFLDHAAALSSLTHALETRPSAPGDPAFPSTS